MFPPEKPKNRRFNPYELEDEIVTAKHWHRPVKSYVYDPPFYPWCVPEPVVNFHLKYNE
nr:MAG: hypothetical protein [Betatorquevirus sp.]